LIRFDKVHAVIMALIAAATVLVAYATYRHTVERDKANAIPPSHGDPNITKRIEKAPEKQQDEKEPEKSGERQKPPDLPPVETPKQPPKEEPKPFTFWGYIPAGQGPARPGILFQVNSCVVGRTQVTCVMTATSPQYDRELIFDSFTTTITDSEGDPFRVQFRSTPVLQLDRDAPLPFKLEFPVNKDLVKPIVVQLHGTVVGSGNLQGASFRIT
jgi:hypothetical protein